MVIGNIAIGAKKTRRRGKSSTRRNCKETTMGGRKKEKRGRGSGDKEERTRRNRTSKRKEKTAGTELVVDFVCDMVSIAFIILSCFLIFFFLIFSYIKRP